MAATIDVLIEQAESLLKKKIAIKESVPGVFEAMANVDDQLRITINDIVGLGLEGELSQAQVNLINTALVGTRAAIASYQNDYRPSVNDLTAEFAILPQIDLRRLKRLKDDDAYLYDQLVNVYGVITQTDFASQGLSVEDIDYIEKAKEAIYGQINKYSSGNLINDNAWYYIVNDARDKGYLWGDLNLAAKKMQEYYGLEFNVKYLTNPQTIK